MGACFAARMTQDIELRRFRPDDKDWLVRQHSTLYARDEGFDDSFGALVDDILTDFLAHHDPKCEAGWIAAQGEKRLGSIFCVRLDEYTAKLRVFLLLPKARGTGLGTRMLHTCMQFARDAGYRGMRLWTHESHKAAGVLYQRNGWSLDSATPVHSFGRDNVEQNWSIRF